MELKLGLEPLAEADEINVLAMKSDVNIAASELGIGGRGDGTFCDRYSGDREGE